MYLEPSEVHAGSPEKSNTLYSTEGEVEVSSFPSANNAARQAT